MKNYWLIKSEPNTYSFEDLENEPDQTAEWDGVRNYQARNNMQKMRLGDELLFYYSNSKPRIIVLQIIPVGSWLILKLKKNSIFLFMLMN